MEKCYEFFNCKQLDCPKREDKRNCWEVEDTDCSIHYESIELIEEELYTFENKCQFCTYYEKYKSYPNK